MHREWEHCYSTEMKTNVRTHALMFPSSVCLDHTSLFIHMTSQFNEPTTTKKIIDWSWRGSLVDKILSM